MPINFSQPEPMAASPGAIQDYPEAVKLTQQHRAQGGGGGGGGPGFGGWGVQGLGGGGGHGGGGDGGVSVIRDPVAEYAAMRGIDTQTAADERNRMSQWVQQNTAQEQSPEDQQRLAQLQQQQQDAAVGRPTEYNLENEDRPFGGTDQPGVQPQPITFSTADQQDLDRLNAGAANVRQQLRNGMIDRRTANELMAQINTHVSPLRAQQQAATTALSQQAAEEAQHRNAMMTAMRNGDGASTAAMVERLTHTYPDGSRIFINPVTGHEHFTPSPRAAAADRAIENAHQLAVHDENDDKEFRTRLEHVTREIMGANNTTAPTPEQQTRIRERMEAMGFHSHDLGEHRAIRTARRTQPPMTGLPESQWTPQQREENSDLDALQRDVNRYQGPWAERMNREIARARTMFHGAGTTLRMPNRGREYLDIIREVRRQLTLPWAGEGGQPSRVSVPQPRAQGPAIPQGDILGGGMMPSM